MSIPRPGLRLGHSLTHPDALRHCEQSEAIQTKPLPRASVSMASPPSAKSSRRSRDRSIWDANASWNHSGGFTEMVDRNGRTEPPCADTSVRRLSLDCFALLAMTGAAMRHGRATDGRRDQDHHREDALETVGKACGDNYGFARLGGPL